MSRWPQEDAFDGPIQAAAVAARLPVPLLKGLIAAESQFNPGAYRFEPLDPATASDDDASRGLTQILYATARALGYPGDANGLFEPAANVQLGAKYLREQIDRAGGDVRGGLSAYNGGWRPQLGFGKRATRALTICLRRDAAGHCLELRPVAPGEFANQRYVDNVLANVAYFAERQAQSLAEVVAETEAREPIGRFVVAASALVALLGLLLWLVRGH